jgi:rare lipoprotein A
MRLRAAQMGAMLASALMTGCIASPRFTSAKAPAAPGEYAMVEEGVASYYAEEFNGRTTSNGERYDMNQMTAAHRTLPFNTRVRVTNKSTGQSIVVRINDRGPFKDDRIIDLSLAGAKALSLISTGTAPVRLEVLQAGEATTPP